MKVDTLENTNKEARRGALHECRYLKRHFMKVNTFDDVHESRDLHQQNMKVTTYVEKLGAGLLPWVYMKVNTFAD